MPSLAKTKLTQCDDIKILFPPIHEDITIKSFQNFSAKQKYIQPVWNENYKNNLESVIKQVKERPDWKISLQSHKIMEIE